MKALALLVALALFAGCTSVTFGGEGELTAKDAESRAVQRARQWRGDAALVGLASIEGGPGSMFFRGDGDNHPAGRPEPDANVGDGRTTAWMLEFLSPSAGSTFGVVVFRNGTVLGGEDLGNGGEQVITNWNVDSPQAAQVAMQDANFSAVARAADGGIAYALGKDDDNPDPFWALTAGSESARDGAFVLINARTGERVPFDFPFGGGGFNFPPGGGGARTCREAHSFGGSVGLQRPEAEHTFEVGRGCDEAEIRVEWDSALPTDGVTFELQDPSGTAVPPRGETEQSDGEFQATYDLRLPGTYTAIVRAASSAPAPVGGGSSYNVEVEVS